jgi:N-acetylglutamate synthase-like GNAT family acetyltransferase
MDGQGLVVRRPQAAEAERVAEFVNGALGGRASVRPRAVIERLGDVGFLVAEEDNVLLGLIGWQVENLVASVTDLLVWPAQERDRVGGALLRKMEAAAADLQAEAALLLLPVTRLSDLSGFCETFGYTLRRVGELPRVWREMAHRAEREDEDEIPVKQLRTDHVLRPL